jgi:FHA domain/Zinc-ribbon containing domain
MDVERLLPTCQRIDARGFSLAGLAVQSGRAGRQPTDRKWSNVESLTTGTLAGTGSFRCEKCGYVVTLAAADELPACPGCNGASFVRASLFASGRFQRRSAEAPTAEERAELMAAARSEVTAPGQYLAYADAGRLRTVKLEKEWTRVGRSLAADVRFDDPTVSRRHALIVRQPDGVRVLDDRSLNGVFVNGERVEWRALADGDEIVVGRYRLHYLVLTAESLAERAPATAPGTPTAG